MMDRVVIVPYDPEWPKTFAKLGLSLRNALGDIALRIDHIGSTAIPGLAAKPTIDIQISVASIEPVDPFRIPLASLGYEWKADNPELTKRYFREKSGERNVHIHVRPGGSFREQYAILFRDYVRSHDQDAQRYAELKYRFADEFGEDRLGYADAKAPLIWEIMRKADEWAASIGWEPGPSDA